VTIRGSSWLTPSVLVFVLSSFDGEKTSVIVHDMQVLLFRVYVAE